MAFSFLSRAANAIVSASDLSRQLSGVKTSLDHLTEARDTLEEIKRNQEERIASQAERLNQLNDRVADLVDEVTSITAERDARQNDINLLDQTVGSLQYDLATEKFRADTSEARSALLAEALDATLAKLNAVRSSLGLPPEPNPHEAIDEASGESPETISEPKAESEEPKYESQLSNWQDEDKGVDPEPTPPSPAPDINPRPWWEQQATAIMGKPIDDDIPF